MLSQIPAMCPDFMLITQVAQWFFSRPPPRGIGSRGSLAMTEDETRTSAKNHGRDDKQFTSLLLM